MQNQHNPVNPHIASIVDCLMRLPEDQLVSWNSKITGASVPYMTHSAPPQPPQDDTAEPEPTDPAEAVEAQEAPAVPSDAEILTDVDQAILDLLYRMDAPMVGPDIADAIGNSLSYVKQRLETGAPLRAEGLVKNKPRVGYYLTDAGREFCS